MTVLLCITWDPANSRHFGEYSQGILNQIDADMILYLVTAPVDRRPEAVVRGLSDAESFALEHGFSHFFHVDSGMKLPAGLLSYLLRLNRPVVVVPHAGRVDLKSGDADFQTLIDRGVRWEVLLVSVDILRRYPFASAFKGDYLAPDRVWFKRLLMENVPIWIETEIRPTPIARSLVDHQLLTGGKDNADSVDNRSIRRGS